MGSALRNAYFIFSHSLSPTRNPNTIPLILCLHSLPSITVSRLPLQTKPEAHRSRSAPASSFCSFSSSMAGSGAEAAPSSVEKQFEDFRVQLQDSGSLRERIRSVAMEIESSTRLMQASLLLVHQSRLTPGTEFFSALYYDTRVVVCSFWFLREMRTFSLVLFPSVQRIDS